MQHKTAQEYFDEGLELTDNSELAIINFNMAIKLNPNRPDFYLWRGIHYEALKQLDLAIDDYTTAIKLNPNDTSAYKYRAERYKEQGKLDLAINDYTAAIKLDPNNAELYLIRGSTYRRAELSLDDYITAAELKPGYSYALEWLVNLPTKNQLFHMLQTLSPIKQIRVDCLNKESILGKKFWEKESLFWECSLEWGILLEIKNYISDLTTSLAIWTFLIGPKLVNEHVLIPDVFMHITASLLGATDTAMKEYLVKINEFQEKIKATKHSEIHKKTEEDAVIELLREGMNHRKQGKYELALEVFNNAKKIDRVYKISTTQISITEFAQKNIGFIKKIALNPSDEESHAKLKEAFDKTWISNKYYLLEMINTLPAITQIQLKPQCYDKKSGLGYKFLQIKESSEHFTGIQFIKNLNEHFTTLLNHLTTWTFLVGPELVRMKILNNDTFHLITAYFLETNITLDYQNSIKKFQDENNHDLHFALCELSLNKLLERLLKTSCSIYRLGLFEQKISLHDYLTNLINLHDITATEKAENIINCLRNHDFIGVEQHLKITRFDSLTQTTGSKIWNAIVSNHPDILNENNQEKNILQPD